MQRKTLFVTTILFALVLFLVGCSSKKIDQALASISLETTEVKTVENLNLPKEAKGYDITWSSDDLNFPIRHYQVVVSALPVDGDKTINLRATINNKSKTFTITIKQDPNVALVTTQINDLRASLPTELSADGAFIIPKKDGFTYDVLSPEINATGMLVNPLTEGEKEITVKIKVTKGAITKEFDHNVTFKYSLSTMGQLKALADKISFKESYSYTEAITLSIDGGDWQTPVKTWETFSISYDSSQINTDTFKVKTLTGDDISATLVLTFKAPNNKTYTKDYTFLIKDNTNEKLLKNEISKFTNLLKDKTFKYNDVITLPTLTGITVNITEETATPLLTITSENIKLSNNHIEIKTAVNVIVKLTKGTTTYQEGFTFSFDNENIALIRRVVAEFKLPESIACDRELTLLNEKEGVSITWQEVGTNLLTIVPGKAYVTDLVAFTVNKTIELKATFTIDYLSKEGQFSVLFKALNPAEVLEAAHDSLTLPATCDFDKALDLPTKEGQLVTITWEGTLVTIVDNKATLIDQSGTNDVIATLTATLNYNANAKTKVFSVTFKYIDRDQEKVDNLANTFEVNPNTVDYDKALTLVDNQDGVSITYTEKNTTLLTLTTTSAKLTDISSVNSNVSCILTILFTYKGKNATKEQTIIFVYYQNFIVTFDHNNGTGTTETVTVRENTTVTPPTNAPTLSGNIFLHWSLDKNKTDEPFVFTTPITQAITLYAIYQTFNVDSINTIRAKADNTIVETIGIVIKTQNKGFYLYDGTGCIYVYLSKNKTELFYQVPNIGDLVLVKGKKVLFSSTQNGGWASVQITFKEVSDSERKCEVMATGQSIPPLKTAFLPSFPELTNDLLTKPEHKFSVVKYTFHITVATSSLEYNITTIDGVAFRLNLDWLSASEKALIQSYFASSANAGKYVGYGIVGSALTNNYLWLIDASQFINQTPLTDEQRVTNVHDNHTYKPNYNKDDKVAAPVVIDGVSLAYSELSDNIKLENNEIMLKDPNITVNTVATFKVTYTLNAVTKTKEVSITFNTDHVITQHTVQVRYSGNTTQPVQDNENFTALLTFEPTVQDDFIFTAHKNDSNNALGLNKDTTIRLYSKTGSVNGSSLDIQVKTGKIKKVIIKFGSVSGKMADKAHITCGAFTQDITGFNNKEITFDNLDATKFTIQNTDNRKSKQVAMTQITIIYEK